MHRRDGNTGLDDVLKRGADLARPTGPVCLSCGTIGTLEEIRARHPGALSCCPERQTMEDRQRIKLIFAAHRGRTIENVRR